MGKDRLFLPWLFRPRLDKPRYLFHNRSYPSCRDELRQSDEPEQFSRLSFPFRSLPCFPFLRRKKILEASFRGFQRPSLPRLWCSRPSRHLWHQHSFNLLYSLVPFYGDNENQLLIESSIKNDPVLMFFSVSIFAPFVEEFTYRIGLVDSIGHKRRWLGVLLSSVIFGAIHFDWSSLFSYIIGGAESGIEPEAILNELMNLPVYIGSGVVLGFVYALSGKISSSLFAHALNNTISFVVLLA